MILKRLLWVNVHPRSLESEVLRAEVGAGLQQHFVDLCVCVCVCVLGWVYVLVRVCGWVGDLLVQYNRVFSDVNIKSPCLVINLDVDLSDSRHLVGQVHGL